MGWKVLINVQTNGIEIGDEKLDKLIKLLREKHGKDFDLESGEVYYLFLKDGLFTLYIEEDTKTLKVEVEFLPEGKTFIYHSDESFEGLI